MSHFLNYFFIVSRYIFNVHLLINQLTMKKKLKRCVINISYSRFKVQLVEIAVLILHICIVGFLWSFGWLVNSLVNLMEAYQSFVTDLQQKTTDLFFYKKTADLFFYNVSPLTMCRHFKNQRKLQIQYFNVCIPLSDILVLDSFINPYQPSVTMLHPLKTSENNSEVFKGNRNVISVCKGLANIQLMFPSWTP